MKLSDKQHSKTHRVLLFGAPKTGKTQLAGTLASAYKILWFDLEKGFETLFQLPQASQSNIEIISIPDTRSYPMAVETMLKVIKGQAVSICERHGKVSCMLCKKDRESGNAEAAEVRVCLNELDENTVVVVDSLTQLTNSCIANITKNQPEDYKLNYDDWGNLGKLMDMFLSHVQQASYNIVCITHETETELEDGKMKLVPTAGTRNASRNTAKYFDECIYCEIKNKKHVAGSSTTYANNIMTGSRTGTRLEDSAETTLLGIFNREAGGSTGESITKLQSALAGLKKNQ